MAPSESGTATASPRITSMLNSPDLGRLLLRLLIGGNMLFHGISKVQTGVDGMKDLLTAKGLPGAMAYGAYVGEVLAPILIILGLFSRIGGLLISFTMVMAIYLVHVPDLTKVDDRSGAWGVELQSMYLLGGLAIFFLGSGRFSLSRGRGPLD